MNRTSVVVSVNQDLCVGNAMCRAIAPSAFIAGPNGKSVVTNPESEDTELRRVGNFLPRQIVSRRTLPDAEHPKMRLWSQHSNRLAWSSYLGSADPDVARAFFSSQCAALRRAFSPK